MRWLCKIGFHKYEWKIFRPKASYSIGYQLGYSMARCSCGHEAHESKGASNLPIIHVNDIQVA